MGQISTAIKNNSEAYWIPPTQKDNASDIFQRRPVSVAAVGEDIVMDIAIVGSFLKNVPNMAGLVRTAEALLGGRAEVALRSDKVLTDPHFLKMSVASERAGHVVAVPEGPR